MSAAVRNFIRAMYRVDANPASHTAIIAAATVATTVVSTMLVSAMTKDYCA